jgi:hypothetical protein
VLQCFSEKNLSIFVLSTRLSLRLPEKLDDKILRKYVRQYIDDIYVEFGKQPSIHLILINIDTRQYFFNILQYITECYIIDGKK